MCGQTYPCVTAQVNRRKPHIWFTQGVWCYGFRNYVWGTGLTVVDAWLVYDCWRRNSRDYLHLGLP